MKKLLPLFSLSLAASVSSLSAADFITAADITTAPPLSGYTGVVGARFGVGAIPAGSSLQVTRLGFFAGKAGTFTGSGVVDFDHTVSLSGPRDWNTRSGDYTALPLASVTVPALNPVDANGWSWVDLPAPVTLNESFYYSLVTTVVSGQTNDPYFNPYVGTDPYVGPGGTPTLIAPGITFLNGAVLDDTWMTGRWGLGNGEEAYGGSGYLGANFQYQFVGPPAITTGLPASIVAEVDDDVALSVTLDDQVTPASYTYLWEYDDLTNGYVTVGTDPTYTITGVQVADTGHYRVTVTNAEGSVQSETALVFAIDSDNDGIYDGYETKTGFYVSPIDTGTLPDNDDSDSDGLKDGEEITTYLTDPTLDDTDFDNLKDGEEVNTYGTDPLDPDSDGDQLFDGEEVLTYLTDPLDVDSDSDGYQDGYEVFTTTSNPNDSEDPGGPNPTAIAIAFNNVNGEVIDYPFSPTTYAGEPTVSQKNWNRTIQIATPAAGTQADIAQPTSGVLVDSSGTATAMTMTYSAEGAWSDLNELETPYGHLYNAFLYNGGTAPSSNIALANIPYEYYDVYVYVGADFNGRTGTVSDGVSTYSFTSASNATSGGGLNTYVETTSPDGFPQANYCVFRGRTASSFSFDVAKAGAEGVGVFGVQIVDLGTAPSGYAGWAGNVDNQDPSDDFNLDGVDNGIAYFMDNTGVITLPGIVGGAITWSNGGNIPASAYGTQFVVQTSQTLALGSWVTVPVGSLTTNTDTTLTYTPPTGQGKWFVRLVVTPN